MYFFDQQAWEDVCDRCGLCCYEREVSVEEKSLNALGLVLKSISASGNSLNLEKMTEYLKEEGYSNCA